MSKLWYVVLVDGDVDYIGLDESNKRYSKAHVADLRSMGCEGIKVRWFESGREAEAFADNIKGY